MASRGLREPIVNKLRRTLTRMDTLDDFQYDESEHYCPRAVILAVNVCLLNNSCKSFNRRFAFNLLKGLYRDHVRETKLKPVRTSRTRKPARSTKAVPSAELHRSPALSSQSTERSLLQGLSHFTSFVQILQRQLRHQTAWAWRQLLQRRGSLQQMCTVLTAGRHRRLLQMTFVHWRYTSVTQRKHKLTSLRRCGFILTKSLHKAFSRLATTDPEKRSLSQLLTQDSSLLKKLAGLNAFLTTMQQQLQMNSEWFWRGLLACRSRNRLQVLAGIENSRKSRERLRSVFTEWQCTLMDSRQKKHQRLQQCVSILLRPVHYAFLKLSTAAKLGTFQTFECHRKMVCQPVLISESMPTAYLTEYYDSQASSTIQEPLKTRVIRKVIRVAQRQTPAPRRVPQSRGPPKQSRVSASYASASPERYSSSNLITKTVAPTRNLHNKQTLKAKNRRAVRSPPKRKPRLEVIKGLARLSRLHFYCRLARERAFFTQLKEARPAHNLLHVAQAFSSIEQLAVHQLKGPFDQLKQKLSIYHTRTVGKASQILKHIFVTHTLTHWRRTTQAAKGQMFVERLERATADRRLRVQCVAFSAVHTQSVCNLKVRAFLVQSCLRRLYFRTIARSFALWFTVRQQRAITRSTLKAHHLSSYMDQVSSRLTCTRHY